MELMVQGFEWYLPYDGNHWQNLMSKITLWQHLGVTGIWLPPAYKGHRGIEDSGYGVYDMYDLGEFKQKGSIKTKYGSKDEFLQLVDYCNQKGIRIYHDIVFNHRLGADDFENISVYEVNTDNRDEVLRELKLDVWSKFTFLGRNNTYSSFNWNASHFKGSDAYDKIFLFKGKKWDQDVSLEYNNYDYLMGLDVDFNNEEVKQELFDWSKWYITLTKAKGIRLDAIKHIQAKFFNDWIPFVKRLGVEDIVGEYWSGYDGELLGYLKLVEDQMKLFDVSLHYNLYDASLYEDYDLRTIFDNTLLQQRPELAVTFVDNHDTQLGQALESFIKPWFKPMAYALLLLRPYGTPCVFYVDLEELPFVKEFMSYRKKYVTNEIEDYFLHPNCIGWICGDLLVVMSNKGKATMEFKVTGSYEGIYGTKDILQSQQDKIVIDIEPKSLKIFKRR